MWLVHETIRTGHARLIRSSGLKFHLGHSMTAAHRYGVCNFEKRGAFAMSKKNWDRVPIDAQSIDAPLSRAAVFLVVTVASELTALTKVCLALDGLDEGPTRGATDLLRFPDHDHVHHLLSEGRALAAEACTSRIRRLLQKSKRNRLHLSAMIDPDIADGGRLTRSRNWGDAEWKSVRQRVTITGTACS